MARDDFAASTNIVTKMHSDSGAYYVTICIQAHEGGHCIFEREYHDSFRRDLAQCR